MTSDHEQKVLSAKTEDSVQTLFLSALDSTQIVSLLSLQKSYKHILR